MMTFDEIYDALFGMCERAERAHRELVNMSDLDYGDWLDYYRIRQLREEQADAYNRHITG